MGVRCQDFQLPLPGCVPCCDFQGDFFAVPDEPPAPLLRLDFRATVPQAKPDIAGVTALGLPTPTRAYLLTEPDVPFFDGADGAQNFTVLNTPGTLLRQRPLMGLSADGVNMQSYTGVEFSGNFNANVVSQLLVNNTSYLDVGAAGSGTFAIGVMLRCMREQPGTTVVINKREALGNGWSIGYSSGGALRLLADDGPSPIVAAVTANVYSGGPWHFAIFRIQRGGVGAERLEILTCYETITADISGLGSLTSTVPFCLGAAVGIQNTPGHTQVNGIWVWEGAAALALTQADVQTFYRHGTDPTGLLTTYTRAGQACDQVGYQAGVGYLQGCFSGVSGAGRGAQIDIGYDAAFSHASRLGIRANIATQNLATNGTDFSGAVWTKTNMTVSTGSGLMADGPDKVRNAQRLTATANNATVEDPIATVAATEYTQSILLKALAGGGNVNARLIQQNITGGVENAGVDIVITEEWQRFDLTATTAAGQVSTGFRLRLDVNGVAVHATMATFVQGRRGLLVMTQGSTLTTPATDIQAAGAAGEWVKGAQGELDIYASCLVQDETYNRRMLSAGVGAGLQNARALIITTSERSQAEIYDNAGVLDHSFSGAIYNHQPPFATRLLWRTTVPVQQPNFLSSIVDNGVAVGGSTGPPWATGDTVTTIHVGQSFGGAAQLNGLVALIESWLPPRTSLPPWP